MKKHPTKEAMDLNFFSQGIVLDLGYAASSILLTVYGVRDFEVPSHSVRLSGPC